MVISPPDSYDYSTTKYLIILQAHVTIRKDDLPWDFMSCNNKAGMSMKFVIECETNSVHHIEEIREYVFLYVPTYIF